MPTYTGYVQSIVKDSSKERAPRKVEMAPEPTHEGYAKVFRVWPLIQDSDGYTQEFLDLTRAKNEGLQVTVDYREQDNGPGRKPSKIVNAVWEGAGPQQGSWSEQPTSQERVDIRFAREFATELATELAPHLAQQTADAVFTRIQGYLKEDSDEGAWHSNRPEERAGVVTESVRSAFLARCEQEGFNEIAVNRAFERVFPERAEQGQPSWRDIQSQEELGHIAVNLGFEWEA